MHPIRFSMFLTALASAGSAGAGTISLPDIDRVSGAPYLAAHEALARTIYKDRDYKHVDQAHREKIEAAQLEIRNLLHGDSTDGGLSDEQRRSINASEDRIAAILADAEKDRRECKRVHKVGSHMPQTVCTTARQLEAQRQKNDSQFKKVQSGP